MFSLLIFLFCIHTVLAAFSLPGLPTLGPEPVQCNLTDICSCQQLSEEDIVVYADTLVECSEFADSNATETVASLNNITIESCGDIYNGTVRSENVSWQLVLATCFQDLPTTTKRHHGLYPLLYASIGAFIGISLCVLVGKFLDKSCGP